MRNLTWTEEMRRFLYNSLVQEFGPYDKWKSRSVPSPGITDRWQKWLNDIAFCLTMQTVPRKKITSDAVINQIQWALTTQKEIAKSHMVSYFCNKSSAYCAGFIDSSMLPQFLLVEPNEKAAEKDKKPPETNEKTPESPKKAKKKPRHKSITYKYVGFGKCIIDTKKKRSYAMHLQLRDCFNLISEGRKCREMAFRAFPPNENPSIIQVIADNKHIMTLKGKVSPLADRQTEPFVVIFEGKDLAKLCNQISRVILSGLAKFESGLLQISIISRNSRPMKNLFKASYSLFLRKPPINPSEYDEAEIENQPV